MLICNRVAGFIIVGGQDNIQMVAGRMLGFFAELGFILPQFPFIAHSRGWSSEDMENNVAMERNSKELADGACMLAKRLLDLAARLIAQDEAPASIERGAARPIGVDGEATREKRSVHRAQISREPSQPTNGGEFRCVV